MGKFDEFLRSNGLTVEDVLKDNLIRIAARVEVVFNTKILEYKLFNTSEQSCREILPDYFFPPNRSKYLCSLIIPFDDANNVITLDYYEKWKAVKEIKDLNNIAEQYKAYVFQSLLRTNEDVCEFIFNEFGDGTIFNIRAIGYEENIGSLNAVNNIDKIENTHYRRIFYFSNDDLETL